MKLALAFFVSLAGISLLQAQSVAPIEYNPEQAGHSKKNPYKITAVTDTINFPFFDDFTTSGVAPDTALWIDNGGTYINNSYAIDPPNFNVATFDGLNASGAPYNSGNPTAIGQADNLTSKPIDLSSLTSGDTIFLRFYWQGGGIGEPPDSNKDSIRLQFKSSTGTWDRIWSVVKDTTSGFKQQKINITDAAKYFYKGFQFRFQSFGRLSGSYDVWHIDYVMLDTGMLAGDNWTPDYSFVTNPTSLLKNYTAMPFSQFRLSELTDTVKATLKSLNNKFSGNKVIDESGHVINIKDNTILDTIPETTFFLAGGQKAVFKWKVDSNAFASLNNESIIKYKFALDSVDGDPRKDSVYNYYVFGDNAGLSRINFQRNDSISGTTHLTDYFAYDDGIAEFGYAVNQYYAKVAVKFNLNEPDTLTHINICFPKIGIDRSTEPIILLVYSDIQTGSSNATLLYNETVVLKHSTSNNVFHSYQLSTPLYITSPQFYVGYQQTVSEYIYVGFDRNHDNRNNTFYNINDTWAKENDDTGAVMIRPVFRSQTVTGTKNKMEELDVQVFPNPSRGELFITGEVEEAYLYDLSGRLITSFTFDIHGNEIRSADISSLPNGFYLIHLINGQKKAIRKIILNR